MCLCACGDCCPESLMLLLLPCRRSLQRRAAPLASLAKKGSLNPCLSG